MSRDPLAARRAALRLIKRGIEEGEPLSEVAFPRDLPPEARAEALRLAREVFRHLGPADVLIEKHSNKSPRGMVHHILRLGAVELAALGQAPHGVVDACVELAKADRKAQPAAGMVNAVLRRIAEGPGFDGIAPLAAAPKWLARVMMEDWGKPTARAIASAHLTSPPLDLTAKDGAEIPDGEILPTWSIRLNNPGKISALPGFAEGGWWAQDAAAALPAQLAGKGDGRRALDLCAAPGGKTMQLAAEGWTVTAVDASAPRLRTLRTNLERTGLKAEVVEADALTWAGGTFDLVLLDAPCSATGTIRRHPELPWIRNGADLDEITKLQREMLDAAWARVAPGGRLIYCVCSLMKAEGEDQAKWFLETHADARHAPIEDGEIREQRFVNEDGNLRTRPDIWAETGGVDGFFASRVTRDA